MMIISVECPACHTSFPVDPRKVPDGGVKVRCSVCAGIFFVEKPEMPPVAPAEVVVAPLHGSGSSESGAGPEPADAPTSPTVESSSPAAESRDSTAVEMAREGGEEAGPERAVEAEHDGSAEWGSDEALDAGVDLSEPHGSGATTDLDLPDDARVDPWSGSGWEEEAEPAPDPWSGGVGLDAAVDAAPLGADHADTDDAGHPDRTDHPDHTAHTDGPDDGWVIEPTHSDGMQALDAPVERLDTVEEETRAAADSLTEEFGTDLEGPSEWEESAVPPAAEAPVAEPPATEPPAVDTPAVEAPRRDETPGYDPVFGTPGMEPPTPETEPTYEGFDETPAAPFVEAPSARSDTPVFEAPAAPEELPHTELPAPEPDTAPEPEHAPVEPAPAAPSKGFQFGRRDPHDKAKRLARVLVSDIITYNPDRHQTALERNSLHADFEDEIRKSWAEYVEQVGSEIAESTPYWFDALNEILARGEKVF